VRREAYYPKREKFSFCRFTIKNLILFSLIYSLPSFRSKVRNPDLHAARGIGNAGLHTVWTVAIGFPPLAHFAPADLYLTPTLPGPTSARDAGEMRLGEKIGESSQERRRSPLRCPPNRSKPTQRGNFALLFGQCATYKIDGAEHPLRRSRNGPGCAEQHPTN
jgi:hypothetical protein